jgi:glycosyltransferase involved in cell wall biosynthesis
MKISVITVAYNAAATIEDTIRSVAAQCHPHVEHIVVDGASTDGTTQILESHRGQLARIISEPDRGIYDAMNKGIGAATGDVIGFLNADDVFADGRVLSRIADAFGDPGMEACYADLIFVDSSDRRKVLRYWRSQPYRKGLFETGWMPAHPTFYARREVYERFGGFDLDYKRQADFELTMRFLGVHKIRSVYFPEIWVHMLPGGISNNSLSGILHGNLEAYRACKKHRLAVTPLFIARKMLSRVPQFFARPKRLV